MNLTDIHTGVEKRKRKKRVGRGIGSGHGKTGSRGAKGQYASAGAGWPSILFEGGQMPIYRRAPKRGFSNGMHAKHYLVVNIGDIDERFEEGTVVDPTTLRQVGLANGTTDGIRVLGTGEVTKKLTIRAHHFSKSALEKIAAKGGTAEVIPGPKPPVRNKMKSKTATPAK